METLTFILGMLGLIGSAIAFVLSWKSRTHNTRADTYSKLISSISTMNETVANLAAEVDEERTKRRAIEEALDAARKEWVIERRLLAQKLAHSDTIISNLEARIQELEREKHELTKLLTKQNELLLEGNKLLKNSGSNGA